MIAAIRVRGRPNMEKKNKDTLNMLNLERNNHCCVFKEIKSVKGMLKKVSDFITWGEIDEKLLEELCERANKEKDLPVVFRIEPPSKGWRNKKEHYKNGGSLGYRGEDINELIRRMM